jgi:predicted kinase
MAPATLVVITGPPGTGKSTLAEAVARQLGTAVLGWDWAMAGMTWCEPVQAALRSLEVESYRRVGWSILANLAEAQLRQGRSVVLDGVARQAEVEALRAVADRTASTLRIVLTSCTDRERHRRRVEGRQRDIPGWHELEWAGVERTLAGWTPPDAPDLVVDTAAEPDPDAIARRVI